MIKPNDPRQLAVDILRRSICSVQVGAVIADAHGIFSWGWNNVGAGFGQHAEVHAIERGRQSRLQGATIYVATIRRRNQKIITSRPCDDCLLMINSFGMQIVWRDRDGRWVYE
jgi:pyrimidine deaminase RibD-like protein